MGRKRPGQTKRPSFQFYPSDWLRDIALRCVSIEARGMWIDMLCYMHDGTPYGYLKVNHKVIDKVNLAHILSLDTKVAERLLNELLEAGVCSQDSAGCLYSKRMVKDEEVRNKRAAGGPLGGNPALKKDNLKVNHKDNLTVNLSTEEEEDILSTISSFKLKKDKPKKQPKIMVAPDVLLTQEEHDKLVASHGAEFMNKVYAWFANYKIEKAYKTKSDYLTIMRWVIGAVKKQTDGQQHPATGAAARTKPLTGAEILLRNLEQSINGTGEINFG